MTVTLPDGTLVSDDYKTLEQAPSDCIDYVIPDTIETVAGYAFFKCSNCKSIYFPESVKTLEAHTFDGLGLITVYYPYDAPYIASIPPFFTLEPYGQTVTVPSIDTLEFLPPPCYN